MTPTLIATIVASYAIGCVTAGYYLVRMKTGEDVRTAGSGATGATNVGRQLGALGFVITLLADAGKGSLAVALARLAELTLWGTWLCIVAVVVGHVWPIQLRGRGGKGAATWMGAMLVHDPRAALFAIAIGAVTRLVIRRFAVAGLVGLVTTPIALMIAGAPRQDVIGTSVLALILLYSHRANVRAMFRDRRPST